MEKRYDFKRDLLCVHKNYRRDFSKKKNDGEIELYDGVAIILPKDADKLTENAARDFSEYLYTSMKIGSMITANDGKYAQKIIISVSSDIDEAAFGPMGYCIDVTDSYISVVGCESEGVAQGLYFLEDLMNIRKAPFLPRKKIARHSIFETRTSQSPFGMFEWTNEALSTLAHYGMNSISLWIKDVNLDNRGGFIDINLLAERAEKYGIKVGIQLYAPHNVHPTEEGAQEFYDSLYGKILKACPKIARIELVGEANHFKSKDERVSNDAKYIDNIPTGKKSPGWFPCSDYPEWVEMIKTAAKKFNPDIEIYFSTYNWGFVDEELRVALIENLPTDITLSPTWDMFEKHKMKDSVQCGVDYSLNFVGPGSYFVSEAKAAKKRGIKLSTNSQSSGRTWDFGTVPYEPMPYQWMKRYEAMIKAHYEWGLVSILENIHYAFQPSIISELEKYMFFTAYEGAPTAEEWLKLLIARDFGEENVDTVDAALRDFSEAITHYPATNEDQYGAFRVGPAYPLWIKDPRIGWGMPGNGKKPNEYNAMFGNGIYFPAYTPDIQGLSSLPGVRIFDEIKLIGEVKNYLEAGLAKLQKAKSENEHLKKLKALSKFMINSCKTALNVKELHILQNRLALAGTKENAAAILDEMDGLIVRERENVLDTIPAVRVDSRLGWEPSMEYQCDEECLNWKLRQLEHEKSITLPELRKSNSH